MSSPFIRNYKAEAAITKYRIVKIGADDDSVLQAAAVGDKMVGVSTELDAAIAERVDVVHAGSAEVEFGGAVTRGDFLTSDATGKAISAAPAAGVNNRVVGFALVSGVAGDIGRIFVAPSQVQG